MRVRGHGEARRRRSAGEPAAGRGPLRDRARRSIEGASQSCGQLFDQTSTTCRQKEEFSLRTLYHLINGAAIAVCLGGLSTASANTQIVADVFETYIFEFPEDTPGVPDNAFIDATNISPTSAIGAGSLTNVLISGCLEPSGCSFGQPSIPFGPFTVLPGESSPSVNQGDDLTSVTVTGDFNGMPFAMAPPGTGGGPGAAVSSFVVSDLDINTGSPGVLIGVLVGSAPSPSIPEPSTWAMVLAGFAGLGWVGHIGRRPIWPANREPRRVSSRLRCRKPERREDETGLG
jgi:PEP-CTERM motif